MKNNNKTKIALGLMALTVISALGLSTVTFAASNDNFGNTASSTSVHSRFGGRNGVNKSDSQKLEMRANRTENETRREAISKALSANDYNAWVSAVGANAPILQKINASNFSQLVQTHNLNMQARTIMTQLGVDGPGMGMGGLNK